MKITNEMAQKPTEIRRAMLNDRNVPRAARTSTIALLAFASFLWLSATVDANAGVMMGNGASTVDATGVALGDTSFAGPDATAVGDTSTASVNNATSIGAHSRAMAASATSLGDTAQANAARSLALGANSMATFSNSVALGFGSVTLYVDDTAYTAFGLNAPQTSVGEVNVGNRTISGVAAGRVDQDAVNVALLKAVASRIDGAVM